MAEQAAHLLEIAVLLGDLHRDAVTEIVRLQHRIADQPAVGLAVATLRVRNLDRRWGLRNVPVKGGKTRDIPLPAAVEQHLDRDVTQYLPTELDDIKPDTPLFWSTFGQRRRGLVRRPMEGKNVWRLCALPDERVAVSC